MTTTKQNSRDDSRGKWEEMAVQAGVPNENVLVWVGNGLVPRDMAKVSVLDSSVQGGDAVWEGIRVYDGRIFMLDRWFSILCCALFHDVSCLFVSLCFVFPFSFFVPCFFLLYILRRLCSGSTVSDDHRTSRFCFLQVFCVEIPPITQQSNSSHVLSIRFRRAPGV